MGKCSAIAILALRKCAQKFRDSGAKINWQTQDRAQLDHDGVHLPVAIRQAHVKQRFGNPQVSRGTDRQELREPFNNAENDGQQVVVQGASMTASMAEIREAKIVMKGSPN